MGGKESKDMLMCSRIASKNEITLNPETLNPL